VGTRVLSWHKVAGSCSSACVLYAFIVWTGTTLP